MLVVDARQVRVAQPVMQRRYATMEGCDAVNIGDVGDVGDVGHVDHVEAVTVATPPREEAITWANGQPAESTPSPEADSKAPATAPSKE